MAGIGIATPYDMGSWRRELDIASEAYRVWNEVDLSSPPAAATGLPVFRENDGTAAAVAEMFRGRGRELDSFVHVFIGAAVGGGIVLNGEYYRGATGYGGDIGLMPVGPPGFHGTGADPQPRYSAYPRLDQFPDPAPARQRRCDHQPERGGGRLRRHPKLVGEWLMTARTL